MIWVSKQQNTVESSSFGSVFVALIIAMELLVSPRFKLRMLGIMIDSSVDVFLCKSFHDEECDINTVSDEQEAQLNMLSKSPRGTVRRYH